MHSFRFTATLMTGIAACLFAPTLFAQTPLLATGDARNVKEPTYPAVCEVLTAQFSSSQRTNPPASDDTNRIQTALNNCENSGKSVVLASTATSDAFYSARINLKTDETLVVDQGVTLFGNDPYSSEGELIGGSHLTNSGIMGPGKIDGRGDIATVLAGKPRLINVQHLTNFTVYNVTLTNAAKMHLYMEEGSGVTVWKLTVATPDNTKNTDGVDIDSLSDVTVAHSSIEDGDDGIVVKTNSAAASDITVKDNLLYGTHGLSIGSQTAFGVTNVLWEHNTVFGTDKFGNVSGDANGIRIKSDPTCGGPVSQITYLNTQLLGVKHLLEFNTAYGKCSIHHITPQIPQYTDIVLDNVISAYSLPGAYSLFEGHNASLPLQIYLAHVHLDSTVQYNRITGNNDSQYANIYLDNSNIVPSGPGVTTANFMMPPTPH